MPTIIKELNWIDISFVILLLGMIYKGVRSGVSGQIVPLIGTFVLVFLSIEFYKSSSEAFFGSMLQDWAKPLSFCLICSLVLFISKIVEKVFNFTSAENMAVIERLGGLIIAVFRTTLICGAFSLFLLLLPVNSINQAVKEESKVALSFARFDINVYHVLSEIINKKRAPEKNVIVQEFIGFLPDAAAKTSGGK